MDIKSRSKIYFVLLFFAASISLAAIMISGADIIRNRGYFNKNYYFSSVQFKSVAANYLESAVKLNTGNEKDDYDPASIKKYMDSKPALKYYIVYNSGKTIYTNIKGVTDINSYLKENALYSLKLPTYIIGDSNYSDINYWLRNTKSEGYIIVLNNTKGYNEIIEGNNYYLSIRQRVIKESCILGIAAVLFLSSLMLIKKLKFKIRSAFKKIPLDLAGIIFLLCNGLMIFYILNMSFFYKPIGTDQFLKLIITTIYTAFVLISIIIMPKGKEEVKAQLKNGYASKIIRSAAQNYHNRSMEFKVYIIIFLTVVFGLCIAFLLLSIENKNFILTIIFLGYVLIYIIVIPRYILVNIRYLNKILKGTEAIISGDLNFSIEEKQHGNLNKLAKNINNMRKSFKNSLESEMKSERLKAELITNVSHDLKTPLTSIINYIDLLKHKSVNNDEINEYVSILDKKSQRLKVIIEDLFEASKITSGSVDLHIEMIDVISLLNQSLAEFDEKIEKSSLEFKVSYPENKIYLNLDGKKTWRVFENLIGNILKYSQKNTRVYIDIVEEGGKVYIIMKNISAYELNFDVDEIFERFKRGDKSRSTEGSGLGLSIAKSIVEMEGGRLNIQIDGDLFKTVIEFRT